MKLRGVNLGNVLGATGVQNLHGKGFWFHHFYKFLPGFKLSGMTPVLKTVTDRARDGNMPLDKNYDPKEWVPRSVVVKFREGLMLNALGLPNPGIKTSLETMEWQSRKDPFIISIASIAKTPQERLQELQHIIDAIGQEQFSAPFGLQVNLSCPNTGHDPKELIKESAKTLEVALQLGVFVMPKFSIASAPIEAVMELQSHPGCDAVCVSNTIPWGWPGINWKELWGTDVSPLAEFGGGGLSGPPLCPLVCDWIYRLRDAGFTKPINGGGGIFCKKDVDKYRKAGASSVFLGTVVTLRPWRVRGIIQHANSLIWP